MANKLPRVQAKFTRKDSTALLTSPDRKTVARVKVCFDGDVLLEITRNGKAERHDFTNALKPTSKAKEPEIVIVMDGGIVQEVLSSEEMTVGVVDYDVEDLDRNDLTDIPQGKGVTEAAYVSLNYPSVMPERTAELLKVIRENVT